MRKLVLLIFLLATPVTAANWDQQCTAQIQSVGACRVDQDGQDGVFFGYWLTQSEALRVRDVLSASFGYSDLVDCTQDRVDLGQCDVSELGNEFPNPEAKRDYVDRMIRMNLRRWVQSREVQEQRSAITEQDVEIDGKSDGDDDLP